MRKAKKREPDLQDTRLEKRKFWFTPEANLTTLATECVQCKKPVSVAESEDNGGLCQSCNDA